MKALYHLFRERRYVGLSTIFHKEYVKKFCSQTLLRSTRRRRVLNDLKMQKLILNKVKSSFKYEIRQFNEISRGSVKVLAKGSLKRINFMLNQPLGTSNHEFFSDKFYNSGTKTFPARVSLKEDSYNLTPVGCNFNSITLEPRCNCHYCLDNR